MIEQMGFSPENITISFSRDYKPRDIMKLIDRSPLKTSKMRKSENNPTRPKETFFGFWLKSTAVKIVFIAILIVCAIIVVRHYMKKTVDTSTPLQIVTNQSIDITPTQIRSIEQIGKWSFLEISDEEIVDTIRRGFFSDDELVRIFTALYALA